jgi:phenylacetate-coenzyme A ligase PaaK-like adenylate-forming protein
MSNFIFNLAISVIQVHINNLLSHRTILRNAERRVIKEVQMAYANVPYYRHKYDQYGVDMKSIKTLADLQKLPVITKDEIREQFPEGIISKQYDINQCHYSATTGSTGRSLPFISVKPPLLFILPPVSVYTP